MTSWNTYKIGDLCKISSSKRIFAKEYKDSGIPFYRGKEIIEKQKGNKISTELYISQERYDEIKAKHGVPIKGDMLLTSVGTLGIPYIVQDEVFYFKDGNLTWFYNFEGIDSRYLYYWFLSPIGKMNIDSKAIGSTQKALTIETLSKFEISLPSLAEQRRIAGILVAIDDKIENNRRINTNLELQAQALYKQWFVDFDFPNEDGKSYKSSGGKMVDSELGQIPEGWSVGDIYKYIKVIYGAPYKSSLFNEKKEGNPLIRIRDLKTFAPQYYTKEILSNTEFINAGDVVAGMDAEFEPCLWLGERGVLNQRCCKFVGKQDSISNYYVMFLVKPELEFVQSYKTGTTVSHLGKADIDKFVVVQPPFAVIEKFSKIADALLNNKIKLAKENITLATLRDTLLPKLMNGEIKL
ncbi:MAG: restriction endonuclease subunit S [Alistipes sp.]|nr:restriction endonuclease subunit S [Alistipes sp.]MBO7282699.1 restriction endonuclease subunit S [Alistipes sp.]